MELRRKIEKKIHDSLNQNNLDALLLIGTDNFHYISGAVLPFASQYPDRSALALLTKEGKIYVLCPPDWAQAVQDQGFNGNIVICDENRGTGIYPFLNELKKVQQEMGSRIGLDMNFWPCTYLNILKKSFSNIDCIEYDEILRQLRIIKTPEEIEMIEKACRQAAIGLLGGINHMEGSLAGNGYTIPEFTERVRVHAYEGGAAGVGHMATQIGTDIQRYFAPQHGIVKNGELLRIDFSSHHNGYWSVNGRILAMGEATKEQETAYDANLQLKKTALGLLKPDVICEDIFEAIKDLAIKENIPLLTEHGVGYGVGLSEREAPYLRPGDKTTLQPGMVLVLDIYTEGLQKELIHSIDTYAITQDGSHLLSWFKNWDRLYEIIGFRSAH